VISHTKSDESRVHSDSFAVPPRMTKSQSQIIMVFYPCKGRFLRVLFTCFLQVK